MSEEQAVVLIDRQQMSISFTQAASGMRDAALEASGLIGRVTNSAEQDDAVAAQTALARIIKLVGEAQHAATSPLNKFKSSIIESCKAFIAEVKEEQLRLGKLVGDFQQVQQAKTEAEARSVNENLSDLERERAKAIAAATDHDDLDRINEDFDRRARELASAIPSPHRAEGQRITADWEITVTDIHALYRSHANCVKLTPLLSEIKTLLDLGVKVQGVTATRQTKAGVRLKKEQKALDV